MHGDMNHILGSLLVIQMRQHENIYTVHNTYTLNFLFFVHLLSSVALPIDLFCFGDFDLVFVGVSRFVGVLGGLCNLFFAFLTLLGSLLHTIAAIVQPKFFLCLWHFVGLSELSEYTSIT